MRIGIFVLLLFALVGKHGAEATGDSGCVEPPPAPPNGRVKENSITCDKGYEIFPPGSELECKKGKWNLPHCVTNLAGQLPTNQSTTHKNFESGHAVEGNPDLCAQTNKEASPWWRIDLLRTTQVLGIKIRGGEAPLTDLEIRVGNSTVVNRNPLCTWIPDAGSGSVMSCARPLVGRYVSVGSTSETQLVLCNVEVYGNEGISRRSCEPELKAGTDLAFFNGTCFEFSLGEGKTFNLARAQCTSRGGDLISGDSLKTPALSLVQGRLETAKARLKRPLVWIGIERDPVFTSRTWRYLNGDVIKKPNWGKDQPNNYNGEQNCAVLDGNRDWAWNDVGCQLDYFYWICEFGPQSCGSPGKPEGIEFKSEVLEKNPLGSVVEFGCREGHFLTGDSSITCLKGRWNSTTPPSCTYVDCGQTESTIKNGAVQKSNRTDFGAKIIFNCNADYELVGAKQISCGKDGAWPEFPQCLYSKCENPPELLNGTSELSGIKRGSKIKYKCHPGHLLIGSGELVCEMGGKWSAPFPTCKYIDCGSVPAIENAEFRYVNGTMLGSVAEVVCKSDYMVEGMPIKTCLPDGTWGGDKHMSCQYIDCGEPEVPPGGIVTGYDYTIGSIIEYHCEDGHVLLGAQHTRTCKSNGEWSGNVPTCEYVDCGRSPPIQYGTIKYVNATYYGSQAIYACALNYKLKSSGVRQCLANASWSGTVPRCEETRCASPVIPLNALITVTNNDRSGLKLQTWANDFNQTFKVGSIVKFRCERGYVLLGPGSMNCISGGLWDQVSPSCSYVDCGLPLPIPHATINLINNATHLGSAVLYECVPGYTLSGDGGRHICSEAGKWKGSQITCKEVRCPEIGEASSTAVGSYAHYKCGKGQILIGYEKRQCLESGSWEGTEPFCEWTECGEPSELPNSRQFSLNKSAIYGAIVEVHCMHGFVLQGPATIKCDGEVWSQSPSCVKADEIPDPSKLGGSLPVLLGLSLGLVLVLALVLFLLWKNRRKRPARTITDPPVGPKDNQMVSYGYYDNPTVDPIYENLDDYGSTAASVVTINGVAVG